MKKNITFLFFSILIISQHTDAALTEKILSIEVNKSSIVNNNLILLKDIAKISGDDNNIVNNVEKICIGYSPLIGKIKVINPSELLIKLAQQGITSFNTDVSLPQNIVVTRGSQLLKKEEIVEDFKLFFQNNLGRESIYQLKELKGAKDILLPEGKLDKQFELIKGLNSENTIPVFLTINVNDTKVATLQLAADVSFLEEAIVATRSIGKDDIINGSDLYIEKREMKTHEKNIFRNIMDVVGLKANCVISKGETIKSDMVRKVPLVKKGDRVLISASSSELKICTVGEILDQGNLGELVRVINVDTHKVIKGKVINNKSIQVEF